MLYFIVPFLFFGIGLWLAFYLLRKDRGSKEPLAAIWAAVGFGFVAVILASIINELLIPIKITELNQVPLGQLFFAMLIVGFTEEAVKFLPLAFFIYKKPYFNEYTDGIIYFALSGLTFGVIENFLYSTTLGAGAGIGRLILTPFFHASGTAIIGFYLIKSKLKHSGLATVAYAYIGVAVLHGIYNFGLGSQIPELVVLSLMISALLTMSIFILMSHANELDKSNNLSASGANNFCRNCGAANEKNNLYCNNCGKRA